MRGSLNANNVRRTGDSMTGRLLISTGNEPVLVLDDPTAANILRLEGTLASVAKYFLAYNPSSDELTIEAGNFADRVGWTLSDGKQQRGITPLARIKVDEQTAENAGAITVTGALTAIIDLAQMTVAVGDRVLVVGRARFTKGATAGLSQVDILKTAGTATILFENSFGQASQSIHQLNATDAFLMAVGIARVTGAGTLTLRLQGFSVGSNSTVSIAFGQLHALQFQGV